MFNQDEIDNSKDKAVILNIINSQYFRDLFTNNGITNVIIFGSLAHGDFTEESDVDIAIIAKNPIAFNDELILTQKLEELLERDIDLIDINDENINNLIKISALNMSMLQYFFENTEKDNSYLFEGLNIMKEEKYTSHMSQYPVIKLG